MATFNPTHVLKGEPHDFKRFNQNVEVLGHVPYETTLYRVRLQNGQVSVASDSMLELIAPPGERVLNDEELKQATHWYGVKGFDLSTIAQHFGVSVESLKSQLRKGV